MLNIPLSGIKKIESIVLGNNEYISLSQGALKVGGIPKEIKKYLSTVLKTDKTDYYQSAWGIMPLRRKLSENIFKHNNVKIDPNQILVAHGCVGALSSIFLTLLEPGDEVILPEPTYPAYEKLTNLARAKTVFVSMKAANELASKKWEFDIEAIKKAKTEKTKIIVFSNPWNPLGIVVPEKTILELLHWCEKNKIYLIVDEAYKDYAFDKNYKSTVGLVNESQYFINVNTFSKNMAMSGWRVGYMILPKNLTLAIGSMQDALISCPNVPAQYAALFALDHEEYTDHFHNILKNNLGLTKKLLQPLIDNNIFSYQEPKGSFFIFLKTGESDSENLAMSILKHAKVSLIPGKFFGKSGRPFLRLCYAREKEVLEEGLNRLNRYFL